MGYDKKGIKLSQHLLKYSSKVTSFHMPGHKFGKVNPLKNINLYQIDATEVDETDNLYNPEGIIKASLEMAKSVYNTIETHYLVNGSSVGILASISAAFNKGDEILIGRNCHRSVYNAILLNELKPFYYYPEVINEFEINGGVSPNEIERILESNTNIKGVVITSPTYEGIVSDIERIAEIVHKYQGVLIVDEAHGAHFNYNDFYPKSAVDCEADFVIQSLHKTLPSMTQTAVLHVCSERVNRIKIKQFLEIYQSSSPSYVLMSSIDSCIRFMAEDIDNQFADYIKRLMDFRERIQKLKNIRLLDLDVIGSHNVFDVDLSKIVVFGNNKLIKGKEIEEFLINRFNIQIEMSMLNGLLLISTIADSQTDFELLNKGFKEIDRLLEGQDDYNPVIENKKTNIKVQQVMIPSQAFKNSVISVELKKADKCICGETIQVYPPGIPLIVPGELITEEIISTIIKHINNGLTVIGVKDMHVKILEI